MNDVLHRKPPRFYKIRKIVSTSMSENSKNNVDKYGGVFGITLPQHIAEQFENVFFTVIKEDNRIILGSCNPEIMKSKNFQFLYNWNQ